MLMRRNVAAGIGPMNKGSIVQRLCSDLIAKNRDINVLLYFSSLKFECLSPGFSHWWIKKFSLFQLFWADHFHTALQGIVGQVRYITASLTCLLSKQ